MSEQAIYTEHVYQEYHYKGYEPIHQREEIVRCRDCRNYHPELYIYFTCELLHFNMSANDFCSLGEPARRANNVQVR